MKGFLAALALVLVTPAAWAQHSGPALAPEGHVMGVMPAAEKELETHIGNGQILYEAGKYKGALLEFRTAWEMRPYWEIRYHLGMTLHKLGRFVESEAELLAYLSKAGNEITLERRLEVESVLADIPDHVGLVKFICDVDGARVFVDTRRVATLPMSQPLKMDAGEHLIEVEAEGYETSYKKVRIPGGQERTFKIVLVKGGETPDDVIGPECPRVMYPVTAEKYKETGVGLLTVGSLLLGGGLVLTPIGAILSARCTGSCDSITRRTAYTLLGTGWVLLVASIPLVISGAHIRLKGIRLQRGALEVSMLPWMTGVSGGAMAGVAGTF